MRKEVRYILSAVYILWPLAAQVNSIIKPAYPARPAMQQTVTQTLEFTYSEREFTPPYRLMAEPTQPVSFQTPEDALRTRAAAMMSQNYEMWLATWDDPAKGQFPDESRNPDSVAETKRQWKAVFSVGRMVLFKRIETRQFVIVTYKMIDDQGRNVGQFELPSIFQKVGEKWLGTQQLSADPLLIESPWITMQPVVRREVR